MLLLLLACAPTPASYGNCVVSSVSSSPYEELGIAYEEVSEYDTEGRIVHSRRDYVDGSTAEVDYRYEGACTARRRGRGGYGDELRVALSTSRCDEHGHVERVEVERWQEDDGEVHAGTSVTEYINVHDEQGRLVEVSPGEYGGDTTTYEWADPCEEPAVARTAVGDGEIRERLVCRLDGQPTERELTLTDLAGSRLGALRTLYAYDLGGRLVAKEHDEGPGSDITSRTTWVYDDPAAPGPTEEERTSHGEVYQTIRTTYDCPR